MVNAREREEVIVEIDADSELAMAFARADKHGKQHPVTIISNGRRYVATRDPFDPVREDNPEAFEAALRAVVGTLTPEEGEQWKRNIHRWREEGSKPPIIREIPD